LRLYLGARIALPSVVSDFTKLPCNGIWITAARKLTRIDLRLAFSQQMSCARVPIYLPTRD